MYRRETSIMPVCSWIGWLPMLNTRKSYIACAVEQSIAYQVTDAIRAAGQVYSGVKVLRADGSLAQDTQLLQFRSDLPHGAMQFPACFPTRLPKAIPHNRSFPKQKNVQPIKRPDAFQNLFSRQTSIKPPDRVCQLKSSLPTQT